MYNKWESTLTKVELFQDINDIQLDSMLSCLKPKISYYKKGENIAIAGDRFEGIGIVLEGEIMITKENAAGNRVILTKLQKESIFGEMIAFSHVNVWPATVIVLEDCSIMFIEPNKIIGSCQQACSSHTTLILNMLKIISKRALVLNRKVEYLAIKSMREKISTFLLEQFNMTGKTTFMIALNRNELADFLNVSRPSMSREIAKMKDEGILDYYKSSFKIVNLELLKACIG
ncbi:MAG: transcriptional regulator [Firmicutes bacterium HGW-Firmicutes-1]|jgi:CRP-like cAMP-binding protein|nr:MAG: transcriptional regulator [Firmicutes bacterium HGW-Firmicutes-1]